MSVLAETVDAVIGVDTHRDTVSAAAVTRIGAVIGETKVSADANGYRKLMNFGRTQAPGTRCWAIEGAGSYGAGLSAYLIGCGERVVEVTRPKRPHRTGGRKSDTIDAIRAAREALRCEHLVDPRRRGQREALRVLVSTRASAVVARTRAINPSRRSSCPHRNQITYCASLRPRPSRDLEHRTTVRVLRSTALRILVLRQEANDLEAEIEPLVAAMQPQLLALTGVGPISGAQVLIS